MARFLDGFVLMVHAQQEPKIRAHMKFLIENLV